MQYCCQRRFHGSNVLLPIVGLFNYGHHPLWLDWDGRSAGDQRGLLLGNLRTQGRHFAIQLDIRFPGVGDILVIKYGLRRAFGGLAAAGREGSAGFGR
jgi:hypothetical protein